ncbi:hypothetical protein HG531_011874 [Fusarium graminearum]|nr:hypothetical protein HG531_011874 [Fusarium graminearum]
MPFSQFTELSLQGFQSSDQTGTFILPRRIEFTNEKRLALLQQRATLTPRLFNLAHLFNPPLKASHGPGVAATGFLQCPETTHDRVQYLDTLFQTTPNSPFAKRYDVLFLDLRLLLVINLLALGSNI